MPKPSSSGRMQNATSDKRLDALPDSRTTVIPWPAVAGALRTAREEAPTAPLADKTVFWRRLCYRLTIAITLPYA